MVRDKKREKVRALSVLWIINKEMAFTFNLLTNITTTLQTVAIDLI